MSVVSCRTAQVVGIVRQGCTICVRALLGIMREELALPTVVGRANCVAVPATLNTVAAFILTVNSLCCGRTGGRQVTWLLAYWEGQ